MKYYRVRPQYDQKTRYTWNNHHQSVPNGVLLANELYTQKEFDRLAMCPAWFEEVEISKRETYISFGVRFQQKGVRHG